MSNPFDELDNDLNDLKAKQDQKIAEANAIREKAEQQKNATIEVLKNNVSPAAQLLTTKLKAVGWKITFETDFYDLKILPLVKLIAHAPGAFKPSEITFQHIKSTDNVQIVFTISKVAGTQGITINNPNAIAVAASDLTEDHAEKQLSAFIKEIIKAVKAGTT